MDLKDLILACKLDQWILVVEFTTFWAVEMKVGWCGGGQVISWSLLEACLCWLSPLSADNTSPLCTRMLLMVGSVQAVSTVSFLAVLWNLGGHHILGQIWWSGWGGLSPDHGAEGYGLMGMVVLGWWLDCRWSWWSFPTLMAFWGMELPLGPEHGQLLRRVVLWAWLIPSWQEVLTCAQQSWSFNSVLCSHRVLFIQRFLYAAFLFFSLSLCAFWIEECCLSGQKQRTAPLFLTPDLLSPSRASHPQSLALFRRQKVGTAAGKVIRFVRTTLAFQNPCSASDFLLSSCEVPSVLRWQLRPNGKQREWKPSSLGGHLLFCCFA